MDTFQTGRDKLGACPTVAESAETETDRLWESRKGHADTQETHTRRGPGLGRVGKESERARG
jgi:hypothetical protein